MKIDAFQPRVTTKELFPHHHQFSKIVLNFTTLRSLIQIQHPSFPYTLTPRLSTLT